MDKKVRIPIDERWIEYLIEIVVIIIGIIGHFRSVIPSRMPQTNVLKRAYEKALQQDIQSDIQELKHTMKLTNFAIAAVQGC